MPCILQSNKHRSDSFFKPKRTKPSLLFDNVNTFKGCQGDEKTLCNSCLGQYERIIGAQISRLTFCEHVSRCFLEQQLLLVLHRTGRFQERILESVILRAVTYVCINGLPYYLVQMLSSLRQCALTWTRIHNPKCKVT